MVEKYVSLPPYANYTDMYAFVFTPAGVLVNAGGDLLEPAESDNSGLFVFDIAEELVGELYWRVVIYKTGTILYSNALAEGGLLPNDDIVYDQYPPVSGTTSSDSSDSSDAGPTGDAQQDTLLEVKALLEAMDTRLTLALASAEAVAGMELETVGMPTTLRKGDARTVENARHIVLRLYGVDGSDTPVLLTGLGSLLFSDCESIVFGLTVNGKETPEVEFDIDWVDDSDGDSYFLITYPENALDDASYVGKPNYTYHHWGVKCTWTSGHDHTVSFGMLKILPKIARG